MRYRSVQKYTVFSTVEVFVASHDAAPQRRPAGSSESIDDRRLVSRVQSVGQSEALQLARRREARPTCRFGNCEGVRAAQQLENDHQRRSDGQPSSAEPSVGVQGMQANTCFSKLL